MSPNPMSVDSMSLNPVVPVYRSFDEVPRDFGPSIAVIGGFCTTGALEVAMACDLRIAADTARISDWHLKTTGLGIGQWGAAVRLTRLVGIDKAKELLLTGVEISGAEASTARTKTPRGRGDPGSGMSRPPCCISVARSTYAQVVSDSASTLAIRAPPSRPISPR